VNIEIRPKTSWALRTFSAVSAFQGVVETSQTYILIAERAEKCRRALGDS
jgi:hypothetical protein